MILEMIASNKLEHIYKLVVLNAAIGIPLGNNKGIKYTY
jgi:hypothetical protein